MFFYGMAGVGKSSFISKFPYALVLDCDDGHKALESMRVVPKSWKDIVEVYEKLAAMKNRGEELPYKQVVIDTITTFVAKARQDFCQETGVEHEGEAEFGRGYAAVKGKVMNLITSFHNLGLGVVFVAHAKEVKENDKMDRYVPEMNVEVFRYLDALADIAFYFRVSTGNNGERVHTICTKPTYQYYAKDRFGIFPEEFAMDYEKFKEPIVKKFNEAKAA